MTVTVYASTDASAPVLTGQVGTLLTVLDACLVNGYGSKTNAGWTKPFANSGNVGCYRNSAVDGTGFSVSINDNGPGAGGAREARVSGFETLSAVATGTGQFPTTGQMASGLFVRKSTTADSTARAWTVVADDTVFYFFAETGDNISPTIAYPFMFGDIFSYKTSDAYRCMIIARQVENGALASGDGFANLNAASATFLSQTYSGNYMARTWLGTGTSIPVGKHIDHAKVGQFGGCASMTGTTIATTGSRAIGISSDPIDFPYPNGPDGGLYVSPIWVHHSGAVRGYLKGAWAPLHDRPLNHNDTYSGSGNMSGKSFLCQSIPAFVASATQAGQVHLETSTTWS